MASDGKEVPVSFPEPGSQGPSTAPVAVQLRCADRLLVLFTLALPFLFFDWALPFVSDTTLGNDYATFSLPQQMELQFSIAHGSFPLFVPGFAGGQTAQAMVLGQVYHPISLLASHLPGYWSGHALDCNTLLRLLSLGLAHLALFAFLRRLGLGRGFAFLLALVTTYNLRMLDLFRYGASLESWTGHLFLCAFVGRYFLAPSSLPARAGIVGATYWLLTSGHPQMAYYGALTAGLFTALLPFLAAAVDPQRRAPWPDVARFWVRTAGLVALGVLLAGAFIVPFAAEFFAGSSRSAAGRDFAWTLAWLDSLSGTLHNLFLPLRADVHGAFGGSALVLLAALLPGVLLLRVRIPAAVWAAWALAVLMFLALQGERTPVYRAMWSVVPLVASLRAPGRLSLLLPVLLGSVLVWLFAHVERRAQNADAGRRCATPALLGSAGLLASLGYLAVGTRFVVSPSVYSPVAINRVSFSTEAAVTALALLTLVLFALLTCLPRRHQGLVAAMCVCACLQTKIVLDNGTWREVIGPTPTYAQWASWKREQIDYRFPSGEGFFDPTMWRQASLFHVEPALARIYFRWRTARDVEDAYRIIGAGVEPQEVIVETADREPPPARPEGAWPLARARLVHSSHNRLRFEIESTQRGYFTLAYPYSGRWAAFVDGQAVAVHRANGGGHALPVPAGHRTVELRYRSPGQLVGWVASGLALVLGSFVLLAPVLGRRHALGRALVVALAAAAMGAWLVRSLYAGQSYGTRYAWSGPERPGPLPNLAYGRRTTMSSTFQLRHHCCPFVGSKGTDGDRARKSGFMTEEENAPVWAVDLGQEREIGKVIAYESRRGQGWNTRPMLVATSRNGVTYALAGQALGEQEDTLVVDFVPPVMARYVVVRASGRCRLSLDEVEVFPPEK